MTHHRNTPPPKGVVASPRLCYNRVPTSRRFVVYAIIRSGGKQYRVAQGDVVSAERDALSNADKEKVTFSEVLMVGGDQPKVGNPLVSGASVVATVLGENRAGKIIVFTKKRPKNQP